MRHLHRNLCPARPCGIANAPGIAGCVKGAEPRRLCPLNATPANNTPSYMVSGDRKSLSGSSLPSSAPSPISAKTRAASSLSLQGKGIAIAFYR